MLIVVRPRQAETQPAEAGTPPFMVFDALQVVALFLLLVIHLAAMFSKEIIRMKTWFCLMLSCIVYCISYLLLVGHQNGPPPPFPLCVFQAGLIYAAPATVAASGFGFVMELYMRLSSSLMMTQLSHRKITILMFLSPLVHLIVLWIAIFAGLSNQHAVERIGPGMYCHVNTGLPTTVTGASVGTFLGLMLLLEVYTVYYLRKRRSGIASLRARGSASAYPFKLFIRVAVFTLVGGLGMIMVDVLMNSNTSAGSANGVVDLLAVIPLSIALLFGSQTEYLKVYLPFFWRRETASPALPANSEPKTETDN